MPIRTGYIDEGGPIDFETDTFRVDLWSESAEGGGYGDLARGVAYSARYLSTDFERGKCAEISTYVIETDDPDVEHGRFAVERRIEIGDAVLEDGVWRPNDSAIIDYEWAGNAIPFDTVEGAQRECDRIGVIDQSHALYLREKSSHVVWSRDKA